MYTISQPQSHNNMKCNGLKRQFYSDPSSPRTAHAILRADCSLHATSGDCSETQLYSEEALHPGTQWKGVQLNSERYMHFLIVVSL